MGALTVDGSDHGRPIVAARAADQSPLTAILGRSIHQQVSRSFVRPPLASEQLRTKTAALSTTSQALSGAASVTVPASNPKDIARLKLAAFGWDASQFSCLDAIWTRESNWNYRAENVYSGAYGIPQSLPASKMATAGPDYLTNPATQIQWGLEYIKSSYGSPCAAWAHWTAYSSY
jgi:resuscitation-promoting factor RpfB